MDAVLNDALKEQKKIDTLCDKLEQQKGPRVDQPGPYILFHILYTASGRSRACGSARTTC